MLKFTEDDLKIIEEQIEAKKKERDKLEGKYEALMDRLGFDTIEEAEAYLEKQKKEVNEAIEKANQLWDEFISEYGDFLELETEE